MSAEKSASICCSDSDKILASLCACFPTSSFQGSVDLPAECCKLLVQNHWQRPAETFMAIGTQLLAVAMLFTVSYNLMKHLLAFIPFIYIYLCLCLCFVYLYIYLYLTN